MQRLLRERSYSKLTLSFCTFLMTCNLSGKKFMRDFNQLHGDEYTREQNIPIQITPRIFYKICPLGPRDLVWWIKKKQGTKKSHFIVPSSQAAKSFTWFSVTIKFSCIRKGKRTSKNILAYGMILKYIYFPWGWNMTFFKEIVKCFLKAIVSLVIYVSSTYLSYTIISIIYMYSTYSTYLLVPRHTRTYECM